MSETFRTEFVCILPNLRVAMSKINRVEHARASRDGFALTKSYIFGHDAVANVNRRVKTKTLFDDFIKQVGMFAFRRGIQFSGEAGKNFGVLSKQGKCPSQERGRCVVTGNQHG